MAWTEITRRKYQRDGLRYASDTTDQEWLLIEPHLPPPASRGRTRKACLRDIVNAIFFIAQSGCQWRMLPKDFPPFTTVQRYFYAWRDDGRWQIINQALLMDVREAAGREEVRPPGSSTANPSRQPRPAVRAVTRRRKWSKAASGISSPTRSACWSARSCTRGTCRIVMVRHRCWTACAARFPGCATCSLMPPTPVTS